MIRWRPLLLVVLCVGLVGCSSTRGRFTILSTKNVDLSQPHASVAKGVSEKEARFWVLFIPFGRAPSGLDCVDEILEDYQADYLTNIKVTDGGWSLLVLGREWVEVRADAWRKDASGTLPTPVVDEADE